MSRRDLTTKELWNILSGNISPDDLERLVGVEGRYIPPNVRRDPHLHLRMTPLVSDFHGPFNYERLMPYADWYRPVEDLQNVDDLLRVFDTTQGYYTEEQHCVLKILYFIIKNAEFPNRSVYHEMLLKLYQTLPNPRALNDFFRKGWTTDVDIGINHFLESMYHFIGPTRIVYENTHDYQRFMELARMIYQRYVIDRASFPTNDPERLSAIVDISHQFDQCAQILGTDEFPSPTAEALQSGITQRRRSPRRSPRGAFRLGGPSGRGRNIPRDYPRLQGSGR